MLSIARMNTEVDKIAGKFEIEYCVASTSISVEWHQTRRSNTRATGIVSQILYRSSELLVLYYSS